jgi:hypothetical protein
MKRCRAAGPNDRGHLEVEIGGIGVLRNPVVAEE